MFLWVRRFDQHGIMPIAGGGLDQTKSFLDAVDFFTAEMNFWREKPRGG